MDNSQTQNEVPVQNDETIEVYIEADGSRRVGTMVFLD
jgi:hypothetical protein